MSRQKLYVVVLSTFFVVSAVLADTFVVPLSVNGSYSSGEYQPIEFDLGVNLLQIHSARFICQGTVTAGLNYWYEPIGSYFRCYLDADEGYMRAQGPIKGVATYPLPEPFSSEPAFESLYGGTWEFLLDGHATGQVSMPTIISLPEFPPISLPSGYLEAASIVIEATLAVPNNKTLASYEPAETRLTVGTYTNDNPTLIASWPVPGSVNDVPPATDACNILKLQWTNEPSREIKVKHSWTDFTFDWSDKEWLIFDVFFPNPSSMPTTIGLWDEACGWISPPVCPPDTAGDWHTIQFYVGNAVGSDDNDVAVLTFMGLGDDAGTIYIDNLRFSTLEDVFLRTISFSDYNWWLKDSGCERAGPGSNYYSNSSQNVWLDPNQYLHLKIDNRADKWYCSEVVAEDSLGYGTHVFTVKGRIDQLDPNVVFGLFTWDTNAPLYHYREIDIEFSRWWDANEPNNAQYVVQPWSTPGNRYRFHIDCEPNDLTTHEITWLPDSICFKSYYGRYPLSNPNDLIESWCYTGPDIPPAGGENDRMNLWLLPPEGSPEGTPGGPPTDGKEVEVVVTSFKFLLLGDFNNDGFLNVADLDTFTHAWLTSPGNPQWDPNCDLFAPHNNFIDFRDFAMLANNWMKGKGL